MKVRFDQITVNVKEKKKPTEEDRHHYIGLEHLDSGSLTVSRWGADVTPKGEKLLMKKGDVLFGKRRAYQKKVAIAPFDGIFSAHGMVLRPNEEIIDRSFFPLFISSDYFLDAAIALSVGSLSPTINWKDLARLEFTLPPLTKQRELAEVLWAIEDTRTAYQRLEQATEELVKSRFIEMFGDPVTNPMGWEVRRLDTMCENLDSKRIPIKSGNRKSGIYPYYGASGIVDYVEDYIFDERLLLVSEDGANLLMRSTPIAFSVSGKIWVNNHAHVLRFEDEALQCFVENYFAMVDISNLITGSAQPKLNQQKLNAMMLPVPSQKMLNEYFAFMEQADKSELAMEKVIEKQTAMKAAVMREWLK